MLINQPISRKSIQSCQYHLINSHFLYVIVWIRLNSCMNKQEQQYQIRKQEQQDTQQADTWIKQQGLNTGTFGITNLQLLQAQQTANTLLTANKHLLNQKQIQTLKKFQQKINNKRISSKLNPKTAYQVLNIGTKINRQLFKEYKKI